MSAMSNSGASHPLKMRVQLSDNLRKMRPRQIMVYFFTKSAVLIYDLSSCQIFSHKWEESLAIRLINATLVNSQIIEISVQSTTQSEHHSNPSASGITSRNQSSSMQHTMQSSLNSIKLASKEAQCGWSFSHKCELLTDGRVRRQR